MEVWKDIVGYENHYIISTMGNIKSIKFNRHLILKTKISKYGYKIICLRLNGTKKFYSIHRLVAITFIENKYNKKCVNHINAIKLDNRIENLEWVTNKENMEHAVRLGLFPRGKETYNYKNRGKKNILSKPINMYGLDNVLIKEFGSQRCAERWLKDNGYPKAYSENISRCCNNKALSSYKHKWKFKEVT